MFSEDTILKYDRPLQNEPFLKVRIQQKAVKAIYTKGTYAEIRNHCKKYPDEKLQTGKWWEYLF